MKASGMIRKPDRVGRLTLPAELRHSLGIRVGESMEFFKEEGCVILCKYNPGCIFCGRPENIVLAFYNRKVCDKCLFDMRQYGIREARWK